MGAGHYSLRRRLCLCDLKESFDRLVPRTSSNGYFCAGVSASFWYVAVSVPLPLAMGSKVG
jgi:hypothetical protein